ncbi:MAG: hypothetical protein JNK82_03100 [Myxococcaceae bacterium]|nr:hypothetical protein [Myxococcaceae bacterium]
MNARIVLALLLALTTSSCGLLIDGAYLLTDKQYTKSVEQRRPSGERETKPEVRLAFEGSRMRVACEDVTRGIDRVWLVDKTYEYQGGFHRAHWLPIILEGAIGAGLAIGLGLKCGDPASRIDCNLLYATIPFGVDVGYSVIRLFTTEPAKLVNKQISTRSAQPSAEPMARTAAWCPPEVEVVVQSTNDPLRVPVAPNGELSLELQQRIISSAVKNRDTRVLVVAPEGQRGETLSRCELLRSFTPLPQGAHDCLPQKP